MKVLDFLDAKSKRDDGLVEGLRNSEDTTRTYEQMHQEKFDEKVAKVLSNIENAILNFDGEFDDMLSEYPFPAHRRDELKEQLNELLIKKLKFNKVGRKVLKPEKIKGYFKYIKKREKREKNDLTGLKVATLGMDSLETMVRLNNLSNVEVWRKGGNRIILSTYSSGSTNVVVLRANIVSGI